MLTDAFDASLHSSTPHDNTNRFNNMLRVHHHSSLEDTRSKTLRSLQLSYNAFV